jgi:hypothetical protein
MTEDEPMIEFAADEIGASVHHKTDGTVLAEGTGAFVKPGRGERLSYVRPGGVLVGLVEGVRTVRQWPADYVPSVAELIGR